MDDDCIFCRIAEGLTSASMVAESEKALAFMDINQPTAGHVLVIPRAHIRDIYGLDPETAAAVFQLTVAVSRAVKLGLGADGLNLMQSNERAGQQEVYHFHMHILARYFGDKDRVRLGWQPAQPPRSELDRLAAQIRAAL